MKRFFPLTLSMLLLMTATAFAANDGTTSLRDSAAKAVEHHPRVKALLHSRDAVSRNLSASLGRFFPSLDLTSEYGLQQYSSGTTRNQTEDNTHSSVSDTTVTLTQNVFDGMDRYNEYEGSKARLNSAEFRLRDNVESVALDAVRAHLDVMRERKLLDLAEKNVSEHRDVLASISERVEAGAGSRADEMQARGRLARAESTVISYKGSLTNAEAAYVRVTGENPGALSVSPFSMEYVPLRMEDVLSVALDNNPKVKVGEAEVQATEKDRNVTDSSMYPDVDIRVSSRHADDLDGVDTYIQDNRAMLALSWNLFSGGSDYNRSKAADSRVEQAQSELQDTTDDLTRQVVTAWSEYETAVEQVAKYQEALQYSRESLDMYMLQFNVGQRSLLDVLDSINEVFSNSVQLETAKSNRTFSLYKLMTLKGELVKTLEIADGVYQDPEDI